MRKFLDKLEPNFKKGGKWEGWYALYEAIDTGLFKPSDVTKNSSHVRDNIDLKRVMITVWLYLPNHVFWYVEHRFPSQQHYG